MTETRKMDPAWKMRWVAALRSGEYKQGREALRSDDDSFCCLGVLTDLCVKEGLVGQWKRLGPDSDYEVDKTAGVAPPSVERVTGLPSPDPEVSERETLSCLNDSGSSFEEIADLIEEVL